ncbi:hypothetical protein Ddye_015618 [Dipteronia dyeriana]|uniref:Uncharacterized protein n=1 Tax=Dipteronia dyeriana TaxID=168575 RepID=A0AAD9U5T3_9ROSI|nr:hypothetical protein Ddye_015618 [Dipteronia dyeriana]
MDRSRSRSRSQELLVKWSDSDSDSWRDKELPTYDPLSHSAKKQRSRLRLAHNAIHVIPLVVMEGRSEESTVDASSGTGGDDPHALVRR